MALPTRSQADWDDDLNNHINALDADVQAADARSIVAASDAAYARNRADEVHTAVISTADAATAGFVNDNASETAQALSATYRTQINAAAPQYGMAPAATGATNAAALAAAIAAVAAGGTVIIPAGTYAITGNITIANDNVTLRGTGDATYLNFTDGGILVDGSAGLTTEIAVHDISIRRNGTAGAALRLKGAGAGTGVARFNASNIRVRSSTGEGLLVDGSYIGTFTGCYFVGCATGIKIQADSVGGTVYGNNLTFVGGETQGCAVAASLNAPIGITFVGHAFEGSTTSGVELPSAAYAANFYGCYFEGNAGWDIKVGTTATCYNVAIHGCVFLNGTSGKASSVIAIRARALGIDTCTFVGYTASLAVSIQEATAGAVMGSASNCWDGDFRSVVTLNGATKFDKSYLGSYGSAGITQHLTGSAVLDFGSIAAGGAADLTVTVTGAAVGDDATWHTSAMLEAGLVVTQCAVTAANTVTIRVRNESGSAIDPFARTYRVRVWR